jgi:hypothetical protein
MPTNHPSQVDKVPEAVLKGESFKGLDMSVSDLFNMIHNICSTEASQEAQDIMLKQLMQSCVDAAAILPTNSPIHQASQMRGGVANLFHFVLHFKALNE